MAELFGGSTEVKGRHLRARVGEGVWGEDGEGEEHVLTEPVWVMGRIGVKLSDGCVVYEWPPKGDSSTQCWNSYKHRPDLLVSFTLMQNPHNLEFRH